MAIVEIDKINILFSKSKKADVILLAYPLMYPMPVQVQKNDLDYYSSVTDKFSFQSFVSGTYSYTHLNNNYCLLCTSCRNGPAMTYSMEVIDHLSLGQIQQAYEVFPRSFANTKAPFGVWTETPTGGTTNFITGAGGFLQVSSKSSEKSPLLLTLAKRVYCIDFRRFCSDLVEFVLVKILLRLILFFLQTLSP
jgi:hypothetical protein